MVNTTTTAAPILLAAGIDDLFTQPVLAESIAAQVARIVRTTSRAFRIPRITGDPSASWVAEGAEITPSDATLDEIEVRPAKLAGLSIVTRELADDSSPEAAQIIGDGLARDVARKLDAAFFGNVAAPAPPGLGSLIGASAATTVSAGTAWTSLDAFTNAIFEAANRSATIAAWVAHPDDARAIATVKESSGSQRALLQPDPTTPTRRVLSGLPLLTTTAVTPGTVWGIDPTRALLVIRDDVEVTSDRSVYFTSDRVAVRATMRVGFAFTQPAALVKIVKGP